MFFENRVPFHSYKIVFRKPCPFRVSSCASRSPFAKTRGGGSKTAFPGPEGLRTPTHLECPLCLPYPFLDLRTFHWNRRLPPIFKGKALSRCYSFQDPQRPPLIQSSLTPHRIRETVGYTSLEVTEGQNYIYHHSHLFYFLFTFKYDLLVIFLIIIRANIYLICLSLSLLSMPPLSTHFPWGAGVGGGSCHG